MGDGLSRREILTSAASTAAAFALGGCAKGVKSTSTGRDGRAASESPKLAVVTNKDRGEAVREALDKLGGMASFVKKGAFVVIKPNAAWGRGPEVGATTHPDTLTAVIKLCKECGAKDILVIDHLIDTPSEMVLTLSGIKPAAEAAGARVIAAQTQNLYVKIRIPKGRSLVSDQVLKDILKCDTFINLATAKVHGDTKVTLGMKNLMGTIWNPQGWHTSESIHQCIADYAGAVKPDLTILDASRLLISHGPKGPGDTRDLHQMIAGTDQVAVDAYGATLFGLKPEDVPHIKLAHAAGLGEIDFAKLKV